MSPYKQPLFNLNEITLTWNDCVYIYAGQRMTLTEFNRDATVQAIRNKNYYTSQDAMHVMAAIKADLESEATVTHGLGCVLEDIHLQLNCYCIPLHEQSTFVQENGEARLGTYQILHFGEALHCTPSTKKNLDASGHDYRYVI